MEDGHCAVDVLQAMLAEIRERDVVDEVARRARDEHLAPVT